MSYDLYDASRQWATRPPDQRFWTVAEMAEACRAYRERSSEVEAHAEDLHFNVPGFDVPTVGDEVMVVGRQDIPARMTHFAFSQAAGLVGAPAGYLRTLPAATAARCLNDGLASRAAERSDLAMLVYEDGGPIVRAIMSPRYCLIWDEDIARRLEDLQDSGWRVPPARPSPSGGADSRPATEADCLGIGGGGGLSVKPGDMIGPAGLYASSKDMFAFMINESRPVDAGGGRVLNRGFFVANSEVGDRAFELTWFLFNHVCGNHIVWGAQDVRRARIVHLGLSAGARAGRALAEDLRAYVDSSDEESERIAIARTKLLGGTRDEVVDALFARKVTTRSNLDSAYAEAEAHPEDHGADPRSVWGMVSGMTRVSQALPYADERVALDKAAGKLMAGAF